MQRQYCNIDNNCNDDNIMHASMWFKIFGGYFNVKPRDKWEGNVPIRSETSIENILSYGFGI